jgi:hypothetical protein
LFIHFIILKRNLHDPDQRARYWASKTPAEKLEAVETIRQTVFGAITLSRNFQEFIG